MIIGLSMGHLHQLWLNHRLTNLGFLTKG